MKHIAHVTLLALSASFASAALAGPASLPQPALVSLRSLVETDAGARKHYDKLKKLADKALTLAPQPLEFIVSAQTLESDPRKVETKDSLSDMTEVEALGWAWAIGGDSRYADKAHDYIVAWAQRNQSDGHPVNETKFEPMIVAYDLLRERFPAPDRALVDEWLRTKADKVWASERNRNQNYQSHRIKIVALVGLALNDRRLIDTALNGFKEQVQNNLRPDGSSVDFELRDALHYHLYDVKPLLRTACAFSYAGQNLIDYKAPNGASLAGAVDFIVPYADGSKTHVEFARSGIKFDKIRANHGEKGYQPHPWEPTRSIEVFSLAACTKPAYAKTADRLAGLPEGQFVDWQAVLNRASRPGGGK